MASIERVDPAHPSRAVTGARPIAAALLLVAGLVGAAILLGMTIAPQSAAALGVPATGDRVVLWLCGIGAVLMLSAGGVLFRRPGFGGAFGLVGALIWLAGLIALKAFGWALAAPLVLGLVGSVTALVSSDRVLGAADPRLVYRQSVAIRVTHWVWAVAMLFLLLSGLQIFNARPNLYIGQQSGFGFDNSILDIYAVNTPDGPRGQTRVLGREFDTTGVLGMSGTAERPQFTAFPGWATIPSYRDLATGRVVHFFFAWVFVGTLAIWLIAALADGHLWRDIILKPRDLRALPRDVFDHIRFRFRHGRSYSPLQKLAYFGVFIVLFPLIILTGITMSPGMDVAWPWLTELFGGRQTARTIHFFTMAAFVVFFVVHVAMVVLANPVNELRSMITGYYRTRGNAEER